MACIFRLMLTMTVIVSHGARYIFVKQTKTWDDANAYCKKTYGTTLASVTSDKETQIIKDHTATNPHARNWIGYRRDKSVNTKWNWADGSTSQYTNWAPNEPNNAISREHCVETWAWSNSQWNDNACANKFNFICNAPVFPEDGTTIAIKSVVTNKYLSGEPAPYYEAKIDKSAVGTWGRFKYIKNNDNTFSLKSYHGRYLLALPPTTNKVYDYTTVIGPWEKFSLIEKDASQNIYYIQTSFKTYLSARPDGSLESNKLTTSSYEQFKIIDVSTNAPTISPTLVPTKSPTVKECDSTITLTKGNNYKVSRRLTSTITGGSQALCIKVSPDTQCTSPLLTISVAQTDYDTNTETIDVLLNNNRIKLCGGSANRFCDTNTCNLPGRQVACTTSYYCPYQEPLSTNNFTNYNKISSINNVLLLDTSPSVHKLCTYSLDATVTLATSCIKANSASPNKLNNELCDHSQWKDTSGVWIRNGCQVKENDQSNIFGRTYIEVDSSKVSSINSYPIEIETIGSYKVNTRWNQYQQRIALMIIFSNHYYYPAAGKGGGSEPPALMSNNGIVGRPGTYPKAFNYADGTPIVLNTNQDIKLKIIIPTKNSAILKYYINDKFVADLTVAKPSLLLTRVGLFSGSADATYTSFTIKYGSP